MVGSKTRDVDEKGERPDLVVFSDQVHIERFGAFVNIRKGKARVVFNLPPSPLTEGDLVYRAWLERRTSGSSQKKHNYEAYPQRMRPVACHMRVLLSIPAKTE